MNDYAKENDYEQDKSDDLKVKLESLLKESLNYDGTTSRELFKKNKKIIEDISLAFDTSTIPKKLLDEMSEIVNFTVITYDVGDIFHLLNDKDYQLIRDGFITIGGEASAGKSSFLSSLSLEILRNNKDMAFLFYSLDDSKLLTGKRILSQILDKNYFLEKPDLYLLTDTQKN